MSRIRAALAAVADKLALTAPLLARARRRDKASRRRAYMAHRQQIGAQALADAARAKGHLRAAAKQDKAALRCGHRAFKSHARAQFWLGRVKVLVQRVHGLETDQAKITAELKKANKVSVRGNKGTGGTPRQRLRVALHLRRTIARRVLEHNYYSQSGLAPLYSRTLKDMPSGIALTALASRTGSTTSADYQPERHDWNGGYTGTEGEHGRRSALPRPSPATWCCTGPSLIIMLR